MTAIKPKKTTPFFNFLFISMASLLILTLFSLFLFFTLSSAHHHHHKLPSSIVPPEIHSACKATRYPQKCESALIQFGHLPRNPNPIQIIQSSIQMFQHGVTEAQSKFRKILEASKHNITRYIAAKNALDTLKNCQYRISSTSNALLPHSEYRLSSTSETTNSLPSHSEYRLSSTNNYLLPRGKIKDARAWLSAASSFTFGTWSGLKNLVDNPLINETMTFLDELVMVGSNALNMVRAYDIFGNGTGSWAPPKTERDGFWEGVGDGYGSGDVIRGVPVGLTANVTVCSRGGGCNYTTVQTAVDGAPVNETRRFVIRIKEGVYDEIVRVPLEKRNLVFLGDGMGKTVITGNLNVGQPGVSTYNSATLGVLGDGFMARDLTVQNTAGPVAYQAVAFRSDSDLSIIENCEFLGNQDTLYVHGLRQFYKSCRIEGNVDFIFGNSASIFQNCLILLRPRQLNATKGENNAITAHSRSDPAQSTGLVFHNCVINGTEEYMKLYHSKPSVHKNFLGRPWKEFSRTVFINCVLEALISPQGWMPWSGDFALKTLYYGEFRNSGPGCNTSGRVPWSSQVPAEHVNAYSVKNFIQGDEWIPTSS